MAESTVRLEDCIACQAQCCRHVAMHIDTPECKRDYDNIRWFLMHENVHVFVDHDGDWMVEFRTRCKHLRSDHTCDSYTTRPNVCREYPDAESECEFCSDNEPHKINFTSAYEFEKYLEKRGIDWRFKKHKL